jgi:hypothetical protein
MGVTLGLLEVSGEARALAVGTAADGVSLCIKGTVWYGMADVTFPDDTPEAGVPR